MATYGITPTGFNPKTLDVLIQEKKGEILNKIKSDANVSDEAVFGQLISSSAEREALLWDIIEQVVANGYTGTASDVSLDLAVSLNNIIRKKATFSRVLIQAFLGPLGLTIPLGTNISVDGNTSSIFATDTEVTLVAGANEIQDFAYSATATSGSIILNHDGEQFTVVFSDTNTVIKASMEALTNIAEVTIVGDGATGFTVEFIGDDGLKPHVLITEVSSTLKDVGSINVLVGISVTQAGIYQGSTTLTAIATGSTYNANEGTLTVFEDTVPGGITTYNEDTAIVGVNVETDSELKVRQQTSVGLGGGSTLSSILTEVQAITGVSSAQAVENDLDVPDAAARPAGSFEVYVYQNSGNLDPSVDFSVAETIWANKPPGSRTWTSASFGDPEYVSVDIVDQQGTTRTVLFSRPTTLFIWLELDLTVDLTKFTSVTANALRNELVLWGNLLGPGEDVVVYPYLIEQISKYVGITDVVTRIAGDASDTVDPVPTTDNNVVIDNGAGGSSEVSNWKSSLISIKLNGTPV